MAPQSLSIQSFFQPETPYVQPAVSNKDETGDEFTTTEANPSLYSAPHAWRPRIQYEDARISSLVPGSRCVHLVGRVVNFHDQPTSTSKLPYATKRCLNVLVRDDTGMIKVKLWFLSINYQLRLSQLVSIWTTLISPADTSRCVSTTTKSAICAIDIFPERDMSCYFMLLADSDDGTLLKTPLGYGRDRQLPGLMTLMSFIEGGHDIPTAKVLFCVKSIGGRRKVTTNKGDLLDVVNVIVFDDTYDATLTLCGCVATSVAHWKTSSTILLLSNPGFRSDRRPTLSINSTTLVEIDPCMGEAEWLRAFAQRLTTREVVNVPFPKGVFDVQAATKADVRVLFTLAELDEHVRGSPADFMGYLSVLVLEMNIVTMQQRGRMFCAECCGVPLYANTTTTNCKHCKQDNALDINPRLVGTFIDETGAIGSGKLVFSIGAWQQLLGMTPQELAQCDSQTLKYLESRILFLRLTLLFGWCEKIGRLCVCRVQTH